LYSNHAYAITGYNAGTNTFILYNPWGSYQPGALSWTQLQATCDQLCVCDTGGSVPMVGKRPAAVITRASFARVLDVAAPRSSPSAGDAAAPTAAAPVTAGSSAASNAAHRVFAAFDDHAALPWQSHDVASSVSRAGRASLIDATLLADDLWLPDEALAALV
jgi:hypothetical protein